MLGKRGGYVQGYNVQIACARHQLLLAIELHDNPADMTALVPVIERVQHNCTAAGLPDPVAAWLADSGYARTANFTALADLPLLVSITREYQQTHATTHHPDTASPPPGTARWPPAWHPPKADSSTPAAAPSSNPASPNCSSGSDDAYTNAAPPPSTPRSNSSARYTT